MWHRNKIKATHHVHSPCCHMLNVTIRDNLKPPSDSDVIKEAHPVGFIVQGHSFDTRRYLNKVKTTGLYIYVTMLDSHSRLRTSPSPSAFVGVDLVHAYIPVETPELLGGSFLASRNCLVCGEYRYAFLQQVKPLFMTDGEQDHLTDL